MKSLSLLLLLVAMMTAATTRKTTEPGGPCCLCQCMSADQNKCAPLCIRLQHGKQIVEEHTMRVCSRTCKRAGVKQLDPHTFWGKDWTLPD